MEQVRCTESLGGFSEGLHMLRLGIDGETRDGATTAVALDDLVGPAAKPCRIQLGWRESVPNVVLICF